MAPEDSLLSARVCCVKSAHHSSVMAWFALLGQASMESSAEAGGFIQTPTCLFKKKNIIPVSACFCCLATSWVVLRGKRGVIDGVCISMVERESEHTPLPLPPLWAAHRHVMMHRITVLLNITQTQHVEMIIIIYCWHICLVGKHTDLLCCLYRSLSQSSIRKMT